MRWIVIFIGAFIASAGALAQERPLLQLDTGGHMAKIQGLAFTPDGNFVVSASDDKVIRIWDWRAEKTVRTIRGRAAPGGMGHIYAMALSPNGRWLAAAGWMAEGNGVRDDAVGDIRLYDFKSGELRALLRGHTDVVNGLAFSPDSRHLISGGSLEGSVFLWDADTGWLPRRLAKHKDLVCAVGFSPDGLRAVTGSDDKTLRLWNVSDGTLLKEMSGHGDKVRVLSISPTDGTIASGDRGGEIRFWDGYTGAPIKLFAKQASGLGSLSFSPNGKMLLSTCRNGPPCSNEPQIVWDVASGQRMVQPKHHDNIVLASTISPDGTLAATAGFNGDIQLWDAETGESKAVLKGTGSPTWAVGFSADGSSIAWGKKLAAKDQNNRGPLEIAFRLPAAGAGLADPEPVASQAGWIRAIPRFGLLSLSHRKGGKYGNDAILDVLTSGKPSGVSIERGSTDGFQHRSYGFAPDGQQIISGGDGGSLAAYTLDGRKAGFFVGHESDVWAIAVSPDGRYLLSGSADQTVRLWNLKTRELLVTIFRGTDSEWVIWTPEGFYAGSPGADRIVGWQVNQGPDMAARYVSAGQLRKALHRPDLIVAKIAGDPDGLVKASAAKLSIDALIRQSLAPTVAILAPENGFKAKEFDENGKLRVRVAVAARITDRGGGIGKVVFRLNGQVVASAYGESHLDRDGVITRAFDLATPDTAIEVVAEDKAGKIESMPAAVTVHADPRALAGVPDLYVLAIGANRYRDTRKNLNFAVTDAGALAQTLKLAGAGYYRHPPVVKTLFDGEVTAEKVGAAFEELAVQVKADDVFVFYIAGHGKTLKAEGDYYFLPPAMDGFSDEQIMKEGIGPAKLSAWFQTIPALKSIWIFDTCESGSAERIQAFRGRDASLDDAALQRLKDATGRTIFMASAEQQSAVEGYRNHGVFTYALLEGLAKAGSSDKVQLFDLADYVTARVPELSRELNACEARGPEDYCQKPVVSLGHTPNYPILPRFPSVLAMLGEGAQQIGIKPTHVLRETTALIENRGTAAGRQIEEGEEVVIVSVEGDLAQIAQDGKVVGYVDKSKLVKLKVH